MKKMVLGIAVILFAICIEISAQGIWSISLGA